MALRRRSNAEPALHGPFERPVPPGLALLAPVVAGVFQELAIGVAVWTKRVGLPEEWYPIHVAPSVVTFELEQSAAPARYPYNYRCFARVLRSRRTVLGNHAGFKDLFVPIGDTPEIRRVLVAGPLTTALPTRSEILGRWYGLAQSRGRLTDPAFARYVSATLATLMLEGPLLGCFERLLTSFGGLVTGEGDPAEHAACANRMRLELLEARLPERMWNAAHAFVDDWKTRTNPTTHSELLNYFGVRRVPEHVLVGSLIPLGDDPDPLDVLLRCHAFQRAAVGIARRAGDMLAGQAGDHGVFFLAHLPGSRSRVRAKLTEFATHLATSARRFGLRLHAGIRLTGDDLLPARYRAALASANRAAAQGRSIAIDEPTPRTDERLLPKLRHVLGQGIEARPQLLEPRFENYVAAVTREAGERIEVLQRELDAGLERLTEPLLSVGVLDERSFLDLRRTLDATAARARTPAALIAPYRRLAVDIQQLIQKPSAARQDRGTRRAAAFVREHSNEPLTLAQVAQVAGFAPGYFSKLFKKNEGTTFQQYMLCLRLDRAAEMLVATKLSIDRIRRLSGFATRGYFNRVFKRAKGTSPIEFRRRKAEQQRRVAGFEPGHPEGIPGSAPSAARSRARG